jgi:hypothetical protein
VCTREMPNFRNNKFKKVVYLHKEASAQTYRTPNRINYRLSNTSSLKDKVFPDNLCRFLDIADIINKDG